MFDGRKWKKPLGSYSGTLWTSQKLLYSGWECEEKVGKSFELVFGFDAFSILSLYTLHRHLCHSKNLDFTGFFSHSSSPALLLSSYFFFIGSTCPFSLISLLSLSSFPHFTVFHDIKCPPISLHRKNTDLLPFQIKNSYHMSPLVLGRMQLKPRLWSITVFCCW